MKLMNVAKKHGSKLAVVGFSMMPFAAFAEDSGITTAIKNAIAAGTSNYSLVVIGLIGLAALAFGLGRITGGMR
tara:strand:- start:5 stop:226 length:222 start_codon:yes stop_codon:yes gene_type:complete